MCLNYISKRFTKLCFKGKRESMLKWIIKNNDKTSLFLVGIYGAMTGIQIAYFTVQPTFENFLWVALGAVLTYFYSVLSYMFIRKQAKEEMKK